MSDSFETLWTCSLLGSSVHGFFQARILEQVIIASSSDVYYLILILRINIWGRSLSYNLEHCAVRLYDQFTISEVGTESLNLNSDFLIPSPVLFLYTTFLPYLLPTRSFSKFKLLFNAQTLLMLIACHIVKLKV